MLLWYCAYHSSCLESTLSSPFILTNWQFLGLFTNDQSLFLRHLVGLPFFIPFSCRCGHVTCSFPMWEQMCCVSDRNFLAGILRGMRVPESLPAVASVKKACTEMQSDHLVTLLSSSSLLTRPGCVMWDANLCVCVRSTEILVAFVTMV